MILLVTVTNGSIEWLEVFNASLIRNPTELRSLPKAGQKTVTMSGKPLKILEQRYQSEKEKRPNLSFAAFVSESALMELERRNILKEAQFLSLAGSSDDIVIIKDTRKNGRLFEVQVRNKKLKCITDNDFECIHVGFALALPEVRKALSR
jgi:hypothetical protein